MSNDSFTVIRDDFIRPQVVMSQPWILGVVVIAIVLGVAYGVRNQITGYIDTPLGLRSKPKIWWVVDDSQRNSRQWLDWGDRTTNDPNEPYLKVCLKRARTYLAADVFELEPIIGRVAAHRTLEEAGCNIPPDADRSPPALWLAWCRAAFLTHLGGLWLDGSVLPIGRAANLQKHLEGKPVLAFGVDPDEGLSATESSSPMASPFGGWSAAPHHPVWSGLAKDLRAVIDAGDQSWSSAECRKSARYAWDRHAAGTIQIDRGVEASRDKYGRRLELDTLLGESEWQDGTTEGALWIPLPDGRDKLERATAWQWFLRLSEKQIGESGFFWAKQAYTRPI